MRRPGGRLFDVTENFNRALAQARQQRGEPQGGIERTVWDVREIAGRNRRKIGLGALAAAGILGAILVGRIFRERLGEIPEVGGESQEPAA